MPAEMCTEFLTGNIHMFPNAQIILHITGRFLTKQMLFNSRNINENALKS